MSAMPSALYLFMMAMRIWMSAACRSGSRQAMRSPKALRQLTRASTDFGRGSRPNASGWLVLGSRLIAFHSQNKTVAANAMAERYVSGHLS